MDRLYLICTIAGQSVAIRAAQVDSVVDIGAISPVPLVAPHVLGLAALRSRLLTIVCSETALGLPRPSRRSKRAVVIEIEGHLYGLLVATIEDARVIEDPPIPIGIRLDQGWGRAAMGMLQFEGEALLLIDPAVLIAGPESRLTAVAS